MKEVDFSKMAKWIDTHTEMPQDAQNRVLRPPSIGTVYALIDPRSSNRNDSRRYIGQTMKDTEVRKGEHLREALDKLQGVNSHKNRWIRKMVSEGVYPEIEILEQMEITDSREPLNKAERLWITKCLALGSKLTNQKDGGGYYLKDEWEKHEKQ